MNKKKIYVNLKRFDVPTEFGGVNCLTDPASWGGRLTTDIQKEILVHQKAAEFAIYLPEAHLIPAISELKVNSTLEVGCQSVYREDLIPNFGAFTSNRPAKAMKALGVETTIIGHCEERQDKQGLLTLAGSNDTTVVNDVFNEQIKRATAAGLKVLYCIGETMSEQGNWQEVLKNQLVRGLKEVDMTKVTIAYEPVWAIGPGKTPPDREYIQKVAKFIKNQTNDLPVVYGGGLKEDNAEMLATIPEIDGGLIALTRFTEAIGFYPEEFGKIIEKYLA